MVRNVKAITRPRPLSFLQGYPVGTVACNQLLRRSTEKECVELMPVVNLTLYSQTHFPSYCCDNFRRINSRGERYPSALCGRCSL